MFAYSIITSSGSSKSPSNQDECVNSEMGLNSLNPESELDTIQLNGIKLCPYNPVSNVTWLEAMKFIKKLNDYYDENYYHYSPIIDPQNRARARHLVRGDNIYNDSDNCRSASRSEFDPIGSSTNAYSMPFN